MKSIILTGASDGLGKEFGKICTQNNIHIIALCRTKPEYECEFIKTDLSDERSITETCESIKEKYNKFDALVNCAGVPGVQKLEEITYDSKQGYPDQLAYTTSKWAVRGTSYNLQLELKKHNCRVIQFNVGGMNTRMHEKYNGNKIENPDEWMSPEDIAELMLHILNLPKKIEVSEITINRKS